MFPLLGGLISGGLNLLGGLFGQQNQSNMNAANIAATEAINAQNVANQQQINQANLTNQDAINNKNIQLAEDFARQGVQWRVQDARNAGINPLAALGASIASPPSAQVGAPMQAPSLNVPKSEGSNAFGSGVAAMGQDISRALAATRSPEEQAVAIEKTRLDLESSQLDNDLKRTQLASTVSRLASGQVGPGIPKPSPKEFQMVRMGDGSVQPMASKDIEGVPWIDEMAKAQYSVRNQMLPAFGYNIPREQGSPSPGYHWYKNPMTGNFYQFKSWGDMWDTVKDLYRQPGPGSFGGT